MTVRELNPKVKPKRMQCCVHLGDRGYTERYMERKIAQCEKHGWDIDLCYRWASHVIDGKPYCNIHAGELALQILLSKEDK